jgi:tetratricopeptide (TPR) repeat protein
LLLAGVTLLVLWAAKSKPYAAVGWFWFLGTLVPVIGLVQVGGTPVADRFTYVPQIGLYLAIAWMIRDWTVSWRYRRQALGLAATLVITALMVCAWKQTSYWRNSETLWRRALACTSDNFIGHNNLGNALLKMGRVDEAITQYQKALEIKPDFAEAHNNLGYVQFQKNNVDEGIAHFQKALQINPDYAEAHYNFGYALCQKGRVDEGITHFQRALQIKPDFAEARNNLGSALLQMGSVNEAIAQYQQALQINPDSTTVRHNLDIALRQKSRVDDALAQCQKALQIKPDSVEALNNLAWLLATCPDAHIRDGVQAVKYGERACELTHTNVTVLVGTLAAAYAEAGRYDDAIAAAQKACALAEKSGEQDLLEKNQKLLELYRAHQSYHEAAAKFVPTAPQL